MPSGAIHLLENPLLRVTFREDATFGLVLQQIENKVDGSKLRLPPGPLFRLRLRQVARADHFTTLTSDVATTRSTPLIAHVTGASPLGANHEQPPLGGRTFLRCDFTFDSIDGGPDDLRVHFTAALLDGLSDRLLCACYFDTSHGRGLTTQALFWCAPIVLRVKPFPRDHYLIAMNGGLVTRDPRHDLVGDGADYRFNTGRKPGIVDPAHDLYPATGFEPEAQPAQFTDRMEVLYPTWASSALAAYGSRGADRTTLYLHDSLHFAPRRLQDTYVDGQIVLDHEALIEDGLVAGNGWGAASGADCRRAETYVRLFKAQGDVLGEEVGLDYQRFTLHAPEGRRITPPRLLARRDGVPGLKRSPLFRTYFKSDDEGETYLTEAIAAEFRIAFPALANEPLFRVNYDLLYSYNNDASGTHPGAIGNSVPDLFGLAADPEKVAYAEELRDEYALHTFGAIVVRRPTPYDGQGYWESEAMDGARVQNHHEALDPGYRSTDDWCKVARTVAAVAFDGTFTRITLSPGLLDPSLFDFFTTYEHATAGVDHAPHPEHLGWLRRRDGAYAFTVERQGRADFEAAAPIVHVAGDRTAEIAVGDLLDLHFVEPQTVPGFDAGASGRIADNAPTSLCAMADSIGNGGATGSGGWGSRYVSELVAKCRPWMSGVLHVLPRLQQVCFGRHGGETPGSNQQLLAWRRLLSHLRAQAGPGFEIWEEDGPYDWLLGLVDGHTRPNIRLDLTTQAASWGASPFFQTAWGPWYRLGSYLGNREGHFTNYGGADFYADFFEGTASKNFREALAGDFLLGRLPSVGISPEPAHAMGSRPDGETAYTPFFHPTHGMHAAGSLASLCARLVHYQLAFKNVNVFGQRVRSLERLGTATVASNPLALEPHHDAMHNIGVDELGSRRAPLFHSVTQDPERRTRLIALFVNESSASRRALYRFDPARYAEALGPTSGRYRITRFAVEPTGATARTSSLATGVTELALALAAASVEAITFEFE